MHYQSLIEHIRRAAKEQPDMFDDGEAESFCEMMLSQACPYLAAQCRLTNECQMIAQATLITNKNAICEQIRQCAPLFSFLDANDIPYAMLKGPMLSHMAYGKYYFRKISSDLDILVQKEHTTTVKTFLKSSGFIQGIYNGKQIIPYTREELVFHLSMTHQTAPYMKTTGNQNLPCTILDINFNIMWGENQNANIMSFFVNDKTSVDRFEVENIYINKLPPLYEFIALCLHHYKDMNSIYLIYSGSNKLYLYLDIYYYLKRNTQAFKSDALQRTCKIMGVTEYVFYCLYYTYILFDDDLLLDYMTVLDNESGRHLLNQYGLMMGEMREWSIDLFDRLFNPDFQNIFRNTLTQKDWEKISINEKMMGKA